MMRKYVLEDEKFSQREGGSSALQDNVVIVNLPSHSLFFISLLPRTMGANRCIAKQADSTRGEM